MLKLYLILDLHTLLSPVDILSYLIRNLDLWIMGDSLVCNSMLKSCVIQIEDKEMLVDLILMDMYYYDIILGIDWLAAYHASVDCFGKEVVF